MKIKNTERFTKELFEALESATWAELKVEHFAWVFKDGHRPEDWMEYNHYAIDDDGEAYCVGLKSPISIKRKDGEHGTLYITVTPDGDVVLFDGENKKEFEYLCSLNPELYSRMEFAITVYKRVAKFFKQLPFYA